MCIIETRSDRRNVNNLGKPVVTFYLAWSVCSTYCEAIQNNESSYHEHPTFPCRQRNRHQTPESVRRRQTSVPPSPVTVYGTLKVHKILPLAPALSHMNSVHILTMSF